MATNVSASQSVEGLKLVGGGSNLKYYDGAQWVAKPLKYWNGSSWVEKDLKYWDGSKWVGGSSGVVDGYAGVQLQSDVTATDSESVISADVKDNISSASAVVELLDITLRVTPEDNQAVSGVSVSQHVTESEQVQLQSDVTATDGESNIKADVKDSISNASATVTLS